MSEDYKIIQKYRKGDREYFGVLYDKYIELIYNFIYYKTHHREITEDLTSITFTKALENLDKFKNKKGGFKPYLYRIARNNIIDYYRTKKIDLNIDDAWDIDSGQDIKIDTDIKLKVETVKKYLQKLTTDQRDIVIMRVWQQMSYSEIADIMGKTNSSCKMAFSRAISTLRKEMPLAILLYLLTIIWTQT